MKMDPLTREKALDLYLPKMDGIKTEDVWSALLGELGDALAPRAGPLYRIHVLDARGRFHYENRIRIDNLLRAMERFLPG